MAGDLGPKKSMNLLVKETGKCFARTTKGNAVQRNLERAKERERERDNVGENRETEDDEDAEAERKIYSLPLELGRLWSQVSRVCGGVRCSFLIRVRLRLVN